jgi:hypothetical protein
LKRVGELGQAIEHLEIEEHVEWVHHSLDVKIKHVSGQLNCMVTQLE